MPSPYDILGTVFGALSLLGGVRCAYGFLKARQPFAQVVHLEETLWATHQRIDELERHGYFERNPALVASYRSALKSMHHWVPTPIPKTVYGGVRLGAISILRRVQATWNRTLRPGSLEDAMPQDDSQDSEGSRAIVANRIGRGTEEANSTYNVSVRRGSLVPAVRGGNILRKANYGYRDGD
ncbi:hypothetical protein TRAPUB_4904 [Trametes pubescens]|uniref:Uncharacterized protein n=1 Tax=Trametes pubescens TaxID=154538 RepID=A0A1M2VA10_TRAPU|nr:hypothetical protein TRAPUB_4904 [Trametes pubescens]